MTSLSKLDQFITGLTGAVQLAERAASNGFLVEYIILGASIVDASLRMGLILQHQIDTRSSELLEELLQQSDGNPIVSEREVYRRARQAGVISQELFDRLQDLYAKRNRVVHRYIISEITTADVFTIARRFEETIPLVNRAIWVVEERQVELGVGMTERVDSEPDPAEMQRRAAEKHGADWLARAFSKRAT